MTTKGLKIGSAIATFLSLGTMLFTNWLEEKQRESMKEEIKMELLEELNGENAEEES